MRSPLSTGSVSRRINAERVVVLGWPRAILLQLAHPLVAAGVAGHSTFRATPVAAARRLHQTVHAMLALTFGDDDTRGRAIAGIRAIHDRVNGVLPNPVGRFAAGTPYSAHDPDLLLWVHATVLDSNVLAFERLVAPLSSEEKDAFCREAVPVAIELGVSAAAVPRDWLSLQAYLSATLVSGDLAIGGPAREVAAAVLEGPVPALAALTGQLTRLLTSAWLPDAVRAEYGVRWTARDERRAGQLQRVIRAVRRPMPRRLAWWTEARRGRMV